MPRLRSSLAPVWLAIALGAGAVPSAWGQGTVSGVVTDRSTNRPLPAAQVSVRSLGIGALTDASGRYTLNNVPSGETVLLVQLLGYRPEERPVTLQAGQRATADFALDQQALALDAIGRILAEPTRPQPYSRHGDGTRFTEHYADGHTREIRTR